MNFQISAFWMEEQISHLSYWTDNPMCLPFGFLWRSVSTRTSVLCSQHFNSTRPAKYAPSYLYTHSFFFFFLEKSQVRLVLFICASTGSRETYQLPHHQWQMILSNPVAKGSDLERLASFHARIVAGLFLYRLCAGYWACHIMSVRQHFMLLLFFFNTTPIKFPTIFFTEHAF